MITPEEACAKLNAKMNDLTKTKKFFRPSEWYKLLEIMTEAMTANCRFHCNEKKVHAIEQKQYFKNYLVNFEKLTDIRSNKKRAADFEKYALAIKLKEKEKKFIKLCDNLPNGKNEKDEIFYEYNKKSKKIEWGSFSNKTFNNKYELLWYGPSF